MFIENQIFHLYAHANGKDNFFNDDLERVIFNSCVTKHLSPWSKKLAFCFEKNHFHLVIKLKSKEEINVAIKEFAIKKYASFREAEINSYIEKYQDIELFVRQMLKNLFNSFAKRYNLIHGRKGCLFRKSFQIKHVDSLDYLSNLIFYVHANPVKDGFTKNISDWKWSSYNDFISNNTDPFFDKEFIINHFKGIENFINFHENKINDLLNKKELDKITQKFLKNFKIFNISIEQV